MATDPEELDPELDVELGGDDDMDDDLDGDDLDGFVVEGEDDAEDADDTGAEDGDGSDADEDDAGAPATGRVQEAAAEDESDGFEEDIAPVVRVPDEEDDAPARRAGEFVCTRCFLVKKDSQLAVRSRKVCRDCA